MKRWIKIVLSVVVAVLVVAQFIPMDRSVPEIDNSQDFLVAENVPTEMATLIKGACYDCHSYNTRYPWYAKVAPLSFWIQKHINHGREELNFSVWATYEADRAAHKLEECFEEVEEQHMPLSSYTWLHPEGQLSDAQRGALVQWFQQQYRSMEGPQ